MPRQARLDIPGALHHIMVRGINKSDIFKNDEDKTRFLERMGQKVSDGKCGVAAWVLMSNHAHILFKSGKDGISIVMRKLLTWYAQDYNRRHHRTGHLFENRYKSILCDEENYLLTLVRYIHLNPIRAHIIRTIEELDHYPWSGHRNLIGKAEYPWMDSGYVLAQFGGTRRKAVAEYRQFIREGIQEKHNPVYSGGGLVRSLGGWSQVLAVRRRGETEAADERILGSGDFVQTVLKDAEESHLRQLKHRRSGHTLAKIIDDEIAGAGIHKQELKEGSRLRSVSRTRALIAWRGRTELGLSSAEIARHLGVATSSITRAIERLGDMEVKQRK